MTCGIWGCILFESKEYTPRPPKKDSGRDFDFPPRPSLKRPKEGPAGPSFGNHPGDGRGCGYGGITLGAFGRTVGAASVPPRGRGFCVGRVSVRALRCARSMEWESHQPTFRNLLYPLLLFPRRSLRWRWRGGSGGWCCYPFKLCHCEERSEVAIRSFGWRFGCGEPVRRAAT